MPACIRGHRELLFRSLHQVNLNLAATEGALAGKAAHFQASPKSHHAAATKGKQDLHQAVLIRQASSLSRPLIWGVWVGLPTTKETTARDCVTRLRLATTQRASAVQAILEAGVGSFAGHPPLIEPVTRTRLVWFCLDKESVGGSRQLVLAFFGLSWARGETLAHIAHQHY